MSKIEEALNILKQLNVPKKQQNERSALALLALTELKENDSWSKAKKVFIRIHDMMGFIEKQYGKKYAENSRETFRRQTLHQFEQEAGIVERNADDLARPTNSPKTTWTLSDDALNVIRAYGSKSWMIKARGLISRTGRTLKEYKTRNGQNKLSIKLESGVVLTFSPGKHNLLQIDIINDFRRYFCKDARVLYVGDTAHKMLHLDNQLLKKLKFKIRKHDILPDVILLDEKNKRIYLIEAVTSHGPMTNKRQIELNKYFAPVKLKKIYVSAFPDFKEFKRHVDDIAWKTEVWLSDIPHHMIHFNGHKFLKIN